MSTVDLYDHLNASDSEHQEAMKGIGKVARIGITTVLVFVVGGLLWSALAPLSLAVMAPGYISVQGSRRAVQHLEGGIVSEILVKDGDHVQEGQVLMRLAAAQAGATVNMLTSQLDGLLAQQARLVAERDRQDKIDFPQELLARKGVASADDAMKGQQSMFDTRKAFLDGRIAITEARREQSGKTIAGYEAQLASVMQQIKLITQERDGVEVLWKKGLAQRPRLLALERSAADLQGQIGALNESIARTKLEMNQLDLQIADLKSTNVTEASEKLRDAQVQMFDVRNRLAAAGDVATRLDVIAPTSGTAVGLSIHTLGQVVKPGETLMEVVPDKTDLVVTAQVKPEDVEDLTMDQTVEVYMTGYHQRRLPLVEGKLTYISADRMTDQHTGIPYYEVKVSVDQEELKDFDNIVLKPGMPAEVAIRTADSTVLDTLLSPITGVLDRGFREP